MKTNIAFLIVFLLLALDASSQTSQTIYNLHPYTKDNRIDLTIANEAQTTPAEQIEVRAIQYPQGITFDNVVRTIESVSPQGKTTVGFTFDVGRPSTIGSNSIDTLKFLVSDRSGATWGKSILVRHALPTTFALEQNFPNPFNPTTTIFYQLPTDSKVILLVYNTLGQEVVTLVNEEKPAGYYEAHFDASNLPTGVYLYRLQAGTYSETKKLMLLK